VLQLPCVIGNYRLVGEIGRGASSVIYKAEDVRLGRPVAIKMLRIDQHLSKHEQKEQIARFRREASAVASLNHPNVVTIFDISEWEENYFIAMELLEGETLRARLLRQGTLTAAEAFPILQQLCAALEHAHKRNLIHRDVKPANIFLLPDGRVKLADFGIARDIDDVGLTQEGWFPGSPAYMSPEQITGEPLDARTDIFSLGVTFYEALAGVKPFRSDTVPMVVHNILHSTPAPLPNVSPHIQNVLLRALEKEAGKRFESARAFANAYQQALGREGRAAAVRRNPASPATAEALEDGALALDAAAMTEPPPSPASQPAEAEAESASSLAATLTQRIRRATSRFRFGALLEGVSAGNAAEAPLASEREEAVALPSRAKGVPLTGEQAPQRVLVGSSAEAVPSARSGVSGSPPVAGRGTPVSDHAETQRPRLAAKRRLRRQARFRAFARTMGEAVRLLGLLFWVAIIAFSVGVGGGTLVEHYSSYRLLSTQSGTLVYPALPSAVTALWDGRGAAASSADTRQRAGMRARRGAARAAEAAGAETGETAGTAPDRTFWTRIGAASLLLCAALLAAIGFRRRRHAHRRLAPARISSLQMGLLILLAMFGGVITGMFLIEKNNLRAELQAGIHAKTSRNHTVTD